MRFLIATSGIFAGGVVGHIVGSGSLQVGNSHFLFLLLISLGALVLSRKNLEGPKLAIVIALAQFGTHFFFSTSGHAELRMAISHFIFGVISYQLIVRMDALFAAIAKIVAKFGLIEFKRLQPVSVLRAVAVTQVDRCINFLFQTEVARRGPPVFAN